MSQDNCRNCDHPLRVHGLDLEDKVVCKSCESPLYLYRCVDYRDIDKETGEIGNRKDEVEDDMEDCNIYGDVS